MLFNSTNFAIFLPIVFILYWALNNNLRVQNLLLFISSYFFYACWDWRFLFLLAFSTLLDYFTGIKIYETDNKKFKKLWLWLSISLNLCLLGFFKYYNFFTASFAEAIANFGFEINPWTLKIILPVGISFYTFHGLSYVIDLYNDKIKPEKNLITYSVFVSFFPLLVAGPIERATHLLPQIKKHRIFDYSKAVDGLRQILWGLLKKMVIADNCAIYVNLIFDNSADYSGSTLVLGAVFFAFQIYGDFSGYSDIAIGTAKLFGIELFRNFAYPYFSRDFAEFWRRWHISLMSWFRDYLYLPLGGGRGGKWMKIRNVFVVFIVSGFWHGANWTSIVWGFLNALFIMPYIILKTEKSKLEIVAQGKYLPTVKELLGMMLTFGLFVFSLIVFRAQNLAHAFQYISIIFSSSLFNLPDQAAYSKTIILLTSLLMLIEWFGRENKHAMEKMSMIQPRVIRWTIYAIIMFLIGMFVPTLNTPFFYFQF